MDKKPQMSVLPISNPAAAGEKRSQAISLQAFLARLIWLCVLPLAMLAGYLAIDHVLTLKSQRDQMAANQARNIANAIDRQIRAHIAALQMMAASLLMDDPPRLAEFYQAAQGFHKNFGGHVILADRSMQMILNSRTPLGESLPKLPTPKGHAAAPMALTTGKPAVGDMFFGPIAHEPLVAVVVPIIRNDQPRFLLVNSIETRQFQHLIDEAALPDGWSLTLLDGKDEVMARRVSPAMTGGPIGNEPHGDFIAESAVSPWSVVIEVPRGELRAPVVAAAVTLAAVILMVTLVSVMGGRLAGRRLSRSVAALAQVPASSNGAYPVIAEVEAVRTLLSDTAAGRENAEFIRRESEAKYRLLAENASDVIWILDMETFRFRYVSPSVERLRGYTAEEVQSQDIAMAITPDSLQYIQAILPGRIEKFLQGHIEFHKDEISQPHKDGTIVRTEITSRFVMNQITGHVEVVGVTRNITERKKADRELRNSLEEKVSLLKEVHHRVKNNLQIVASLLGLQASRSTSQEVVDVLELTRNRVKSMALLHEALYSTGNLARINFSTYVKDLCGQLLLSFGPVAGRVKLEYRTMQVGLPLENSVPCGLIVNELVSNALKHGFPGKRTGRITVELEPADGWMLVLSVCDDGVGLPSGLDPAGTATLGLQLVSILSDQLGGQLQVGPSHGPGAAFRVTFPVPENTLIEGES